MFPVPVYGPSVLAPGSVVSLADDYVPGSRSGGWSVDEVRCNRTYTNKIKMEVASQYIGPAQVIYLTGVRIGNTYRFPLYASSPTEIDTGSFVQSIHAESASEQGPGGIVLWTITIEYAPFDVYHQLGTTNISDGHVNPVDRVPELYWDSAKYDIYRPEDQDSPPSPYLNTAGDPIIDPPKAEETRPVLKIVRNEPNFIDYSPFKDTVNADVFLSYPPNTVKCRDVKTERFYDPDWGYFYKVTYEFEFRNTLDGFGFTSRIANLGYRYKKNGTGTPINAIDGQGATVTDAVALQKNGDLLPPGQDPYFLEFVDYPPMPFAALMIPDDIFQTNL